MPTEAVIWKKNIKQVLRSPWRFWSPRIASLAGFTYKSLRNNAQKYFAFSSQVVCALYAPCMSMPLTVRGMTERGPAVDRVPHQIQNQATINVRTVGSRLCLFVFLSSVHRGFSLVLDPKGRLGWLGVLVRNLRKIVNVSESSGAGSPGLSRIKRIRRLCVVFLSCDCNLLTIVWHDVVWPTCKYFVDCFHYHARLHVLYLWQLWCIFMCGRCARVYIDCCGMLSVWFSFELNRREWIIHSFIQLFILTPASRHAVCLPCLE